MYDTHTLKICMKFSLCCRVLRCQFVWLFFFKMKNTRDFPGGSGVRNPPANTGDVSSVLDPGRSHMLWSY